MKELIKQAEALMKEELERANKQYSLFSSPHEGYAVLLEEVEELEEELKIVKAIVETMWGDIKVNDDTTHYARTMQQHIKHLIAEAVQVGAMAMKYELSFEGGVEHEK